MFTVYLLISNDYKKTYIGFSDDIKRRVKEHTKGKVKTTKNFNGFRCFNLEEVDDIITAREKEKYWKSHAGRVKLKKYISKINVPSSSG